ncbi:MAG: two-component sensor histidine kinase, partial [Gammaproteobacteria bacterium HGW-Gammaproteobacteria-9]
MKPASLSMRLGLSVSLMGAALVVLLAALAYFALTHELDYLAKKSLDGKLEQIQHNLADDMSAHAIAPQPHALLDLVMGHDNLHLTIYGKKSGTKLLLNLGKKSLEPVLANIPAGDTPNYRSWVDADGNNFLTASKVMLLNDGDHVRVLLSIDRSADEALLSAYLKSTLIALPLLLVLIGMGAWWIVQRGLSPLRQFRQVASLISTQDLT